MTHQEIIQREFEAASGEAVLEVRFTEDEQIVVETDTDTYTMEIGSDDDGFVFVSGEPGRGTIRFPFPPDWPVL